MSQLSDTNSDESSIRRRSVSSYSFSTSDWKNKCQDEIVIHVVHGVHPKMLTVNVGHFIAGRGGQLIGAPLQVDGEVLGPPYVIGLHLI